MRGSDHYLRLICKINGSSMVRCSSRFADILYNSRDIVHEILHFDVLYCTYIPIYSKLSTRCLLNLVKIQEAVGEYPITPHDADLIEELTPQIMATRAPFPPFRPQIVSTLLGVIRNIPGFPTSFADIFNLVAFITSFSLRYLLSFFPPFL